MGVAGAIGVAALLAGLFPAGLCYNALVTVVGISGSQNLIMYRLAELLASRGHKVTILKWEVFPEAKTPKIHRAVEWSYPLVADPGRQNELKQFMAGGWAATSGMPIPFGAMKALSAAVTGGCDRALKDKTFLAKLREETYDVIVLHFVDFCGLGLTHVLGNPSYVLMSTAFMVDPMAWYSGSSSPASFVPSGPNSVTDRMSFVERTKNLAMTVVINGVFQYLILPAFTDIFRQNFGPSFPDFKLIVQKTQLYFINSDPFFEYPRPLNPNVIYVGGLTMKKPEALSADWQTLMDEAPSDGVVVFSLGTVANTTFMPKHMKTAFLDAFKRIPQRVVWRLEGGYPEAAKVKNIHLTDWIPQKDLLAHPKVRLFITHGGYNSLTEATYAGIPLIVLPLFGDQFSNAKRVERLKIGATLLKEELTAEKIYQTISDVIGDRELSERARRLGRMIREKPVSSLDQAVGWLEFLAEFKTLDNLMTASLDLNLIQYFSLDVIAVVFALLFAFIWLSWKLLRCCCRCVCGRRKVKSE